MRSNVGAGFPRPIARETDAGGENPPLQCCAHYSFKCHISYRYDSSPVLRLRYTAAVRLHAEPDDERAQRTQYESSHREREPDLTLRLEDIIREERHQDRA